MTPTTFPQKNTTLLAPAGMANCCDLPVYRDGHQVISCWQPDEAEQAAIAAGAPVWLIVVSGRSSPPVGLSTVSPFLPPEAISGG
jgi:hypothetical protein